MASIMSAIDYVLRQEDSRMTGEITDDPRDRGGKTRYGIAQRFHPELNATGFFNTMPRLLALNTAHSVYDKQYCEPLQIKSIIGQLKANALLSFAVNEGVETSIKVLQKALGVAVDGIVGPKTLNSINSSSLLPALYGEQYAHYAAIVAADPTQERFFDGWISRCKQDCKIAA